MNSGYQQHPGGAYVGAQHSINAPPPVIGMAPGMQAQSVTPPAVGGGGKTKAKAERYNVGPFIISYPNIFVPRMPQKPKAGDVPQYSAELIVYATNPLYVQLWTHMINIARKCYRDKTGQEPTHWPTHPPQSTSYAARVEGCPIKDLYWRRSYDGPPGFVISTNSKSKVSVYCGNPVRDATTEDVYAGAVVQVNVGPFYYDNDSNQGVKFYLNTVLKVADGPRLAASHDGKQDVEDMLSSGVQVVETIPEMPAQPGYGIPSGIPQQYQQPVYQQPIPPQYQQPVYQQPVPPQYQQPAAPPVIPQGYAQPQAVPAGMMPGYAQQGQPQMPGMMPPPQQGVPQGAYGHPGTQGLPY
jgi:hypothetical protein